ncbi:MAG: PUA domain-containing protein, partial [Acidimicrobiales bacterium]
ASKVAAAKMAAWSGVTTVIAPARVERALARALSGQPGAGTVVHARAARLSARKSWIAFAVPSRGRVEVNEGARRALEEEGRSLLPVGVTAVEGDFAEGDAVEVVAPDGAVVAKGLARVGAAEVASAEVVVVHRDDLVLLRRG